MDIKNIHCVVTGAGRGLGKEITTQLLKNGAFVHACDISEDAMESLKKETEGLQITYNVCDVSNEESVVEMFKKFEKVDVLVNNAGITRDGLFIKVRDNNTTTMSLEKFQKVLNVNLVGVFLSAREAAVKMANGNGGVIINISSVSRAGNFGQTNYSAAKAGVDAMTVTWSKELAKYNIRCAAIAPGYINTEMVEKINPKILNGIKTQVPLKRLGEMYEIAQTVIFIINNDFVNGKILEIDGGLRI